MPRGQKSGEGTTRIAPNGYHYTKVENKWRLTHHLIAEEHILHRHVMKNERVVFIDGDRTNLDPKNINVVIKGGTSVYLLQRRILKLEQQKADLEVELESCHARLAELLREGDPERH